MERQAKHPVRSLEKTLELIELLKQEGEARIYELADNVELGESAVHNHLATLREHGYVVKSGDEYRLGMKFLDIGGDIQNRDELYRAAKPVVEEAARETGERADIVTEEQDMGVYLAHARGPQVNDLDLHTGTRFELWATPAGKVILASVSEDRRETILARQGSEDQGAPPIDELDQIRNDGYAVGSHVTENRRSVAAPITIDDRVLGALSVSAPISRKDDDWFEADLPDLVVEKVGDIETNVQSMFLRDAWINSSTVRSS